MAAESDIESSIDHGARWGRWRLWLRRLDPRTVMGGLRRAPRLRRLVPVLALAIVAYYAGLIVVYRFIDPPGSTLMLGRAVLGKPVMQRWVGIEEMSPDLLKAVLMAEDARFCRHSGIDWLAVEAAIDEVERGRSRLRGASTISMQTAKNLFLWPSRSYVRKALELPLALWIELVWPKRRILEVYLNIVEWAPGVFGAEAAARHHFGKSARRLARREATLLAAALPNPAVRRAGRPGPRTRRIAGRIARRMKGAGPWIGCVL